MSTGITGQSITAGCIIIPALSGPHRIRVPTRIPIVEEVILLAICKEDPIHLQGILLLQGNTDQIHHIEAQEAIQFHQEAVWKEDHIHLDRLITLPQEAADLRHHLVEADLQVPDPGVPQGHHREDLHQEDLHQEVLLRAGDRLTQ